MRKVAIFLIHFFVLVVYSSLISFAQLTPEDETFIQNFMEEHKIPGISIAVVTEGEISYTKAFGVADSKKGTPLTTETLFQAASISKSVAASLYMRQVQAGKISLDASINDYLSSWKLPPYKNQADQVASVRQLLSHTGGTNMSGFLGWRQDKKRIPTLDELLEGKRVHMWEKKIKHKYVPGYQYQYSGGVYCVLEKAISELNDKDFPALIQEEVLEACGMDASFYNYKKLSVEQEKRISIGHKKNGKPVKGNYNVYPQMAAAGLWTTPSDLARFLIEIQKSLKASSSFLSQESAQEMITIPKLESGQISSYGLGFQLFLDKENQVNGFSHSGSNWGFSCIMASHASDEKAFVVMSNRNSIYLAPVARMIMKRIGIQP
ncbi:MAG: serine hydrolase domain-containing protein [Bacteroidota bacterium]